MSYDRQIDQLCPHVVTQEALFLDADHMTLRPIRPIAALNSVVVRVNGELDIPSTGLNRAANILSTRQGPFTITAGVNDKVTIRVNNGPDQTATLHASSGLPISRIVDTLNQSFTGLVFYETDRRLGIRSADPGRGESFFTRPTSTFLGSIGIPLNREYRGGLVTPGWSLVRDPASLDDRPKRNIIFNEPLKGFNDYVEITYSTERQECRRCGATGMENDWRYAINGEVVQVVDEALLIQEVQKLMLTIKGSNPFFDWYGTSLLDSVGKKITASGVLQNIIVSDIQSAFRRYLSIKRQQEENIGQLLTDREYPVALVSVDLKQSKTDMTVFFVTITVRNRSRDPIVLERGIRFPLPLDFVEANSALGAIRQSLSDYVLVG